MIYDGEYIAGKLRRWEKYLDAFRLPAWEDIPDFGLYMDQILVLLTQYLDYMPAEIREESILTAPAVNNYVRMKIMPGPRRKKYYRTHIAYLVMICTLKQSLSIAFVKKVIPVGISDDEVRAIYSAYVQRHRAVCRNFIEQVKGAAAPILHPQDGARSADEVSDLVTGVAVAAGFSKLLAEKLILLQGAGVEPPSEK